MFFNYNEKSIENNPYFRDSSQFPYAPVPKYEQLYPQFPAPPQYTSGMQTTEEIGQSYDMQSPEIPVMQNYYQQSLGYPLPYPVQSMEEGYSQQTPYGVYQSYQKEYSQPLGMGGYQDSSSYYSGYPQSYTPPTQQTTASYGPFSPYPQNKKNQQKQTSQFNNFMSQFKNNDGGMDINKMMNTAGTMMNAFNQLGGLAKQVGGFFIK